MTSAHELLSFLNERGISYQEYSHPAVFNCDQAKQYLGHIPGVGTKNLFVRDQSATNFFLVTTSEDKRVQLKQLGNMLGVGKLSFGSAEQLLEILGILPGSVSLFALINDVQKRCHVVIDESLRQSEGLQCHPLVNTQTLVVSIPALELFLEVVAARYRWMVIPESA